MKFNKRLTKRLRRKIVLDAHALLARRGGWIKGSWKEIGGDGKPKFCLVGAINEAARMNGLTYDRDVPIGRTDEAVAEAISIETYIRRERPKFGAAMAFNDDRKTRKRDVLAVLDGYAEELS